jgi:hypothetical protein
MLPWRNSWFQIAFFAWLVSGTLLAVDYTPKIPVNMAWLNSFHRDLRQSSEAHAKTLPPSEQPSPPRGSAPPRQTSRPSPTGPTTNGPNPSVGSGGSAELARAEGAFHMNDYIEAMQWYQEAASHGNAEAEARIGDLYFNGLGVRQDYAEALKRYHKAASQGNSEAKFDMGYIFDHGLGVPKDHPEALKWYEEAAAKGYEPAKQALAAE